MEELGKINKPDAEIYKQGRKIYLIPIIYAGENAPQEFLARVTTYWKQVAEQIKNLEEKIGTVKHVYHEHVTAEKDDGLKIIENLNVKAIDLVKDKCSSGACLEATEDKNLLEESLDWQRCLLGGLISEAVARKVMDFFLEASKKRYEFIGKKINDSLLQDEASILIINERHSIQFASDIQVFRVAPPSLDEIYKWLRDQQQSAIKNDKADSQ